MHVVKVLESNLGAGLTSTPLIIQSKASCCPTVLIFEYLFTVIQTMQRARSTTEADMKSGYENVK